MRARDRCSLRRRTAALIKSGKVPDVSFRDAQKNYKKALEKGILKILSKMGISLLSCYHGAQIFEVPAPRLVCACWACVRMLVVASDVVAA